MLSVLLREAARYWQMVVLPQPVSPTKRTGSLNSQALPESTRNHKLSAQDFWNKEIKERRLTEEHSQLAHIGSPHDVLEARRCILEKMLQNMSSNGGRLFIYCNGY